MLNASAADPKVFAWSRTSCCVTRSMLQGQLRPARPCASLTPELQTRCLQQCKHGVFSSVPQYPARQRLQRNASVVCNTIALEREVESAQTPGSQDCLPAPAPGRLENNAQNFVEEHRIRAYEVGVDQKATLITLANLLQVPTLCAHKVSHQGSAA